MPRAMRSEEQNKDRIYARVTVDGQRVEISTSQTTTSGLFNSRAQRCLDNSKEARQVNESINLYNFKINEIRQHLLRSGHVVTAEAIRRVFNGKSAVEEEPIPTVIQFYHEHNERMKSLIGIDIKAATHERHETSLKHVNDFIRMRFKKDDIDFNEVTYSFVTDYEHYLKVVRKCNHNTTMKYIKNFGKIVRLAISERIIVFNPMDKFKVTYKPVKRQVLTQEEIKLLIALEIDDERLNRVRDLFLFCIYTGLAFVDLSKTKSHLSHWPTYFCHHGNTERRSAFRSRFKDVGTQQYPNHSTLRQSA